MAVLCTSTSTSVHVQVRCTLIQLNARVMVFHAADKPARTVKTYKSIELSSETVRGYFHYNLQIGLDLT